MRFLVDTQLPKKICSWLNDIGHEAKHTLDLFLKNKTPDHQIIIEITFRLFIFSN